MDMVFARFTISIPDLVSVPSYYSVSTSIQYPIQCTEYLHTNMAQYSRYATIQTHMANPLLCDLLLNTFYGVLDKSTTMASNTKASIVSF